MREIKFRQALVSGKEETFYKWHYWGIVDGKTVEAEDSNYEGPTYIRNAGCNIKQYPERSQQYTGLRDKNDKEIYHKDRVSAYGYSNWIVEWHNNGWKLKQEDGTNYQEIPEAVIVYGNTFEEGK